MELSAMLAAGYQGDFAIEGLRLGDQLRGDGRSLEERVVGRRADELDDPADPGVARVHGVGIGIVLHQDEDARRALKVGTDPLDTRPLLGALQLRLEHAFREGA